MLKAVLYGRYSSHAQNDASIEQQFADCRKFAEKNDFIIVGEYADRALSGTTDKRPEFQRMIKDSAKKQFDVVICWKIDRFARNRYDSAHYKYKLKSNGVKVIYAKESIPDGPEGILLEAILEGSAEYYSANLAQNVRRGMIDNAKQGKVNGGVIATGYARGSDGRYVIDKARGVIVTEAYDLIDSGVSVKNVIDIFNAKGYRTEKGRPFTKNSLYHMLHNERYTGVYVFGDVRIEGAIPVLVDKEKFDRVQRRLERNRRSPASASNQTYLLTGKLFCGNCGEPMTGECGYGKSGLAYYYYKCRAQKRKTGSCNKKPAKKDFIEDLVRNITYKTVLVPEVIDRIATAAIELQKKERDNSPLELLKSRLREVEKGLQNILAAIEAGIITPTTKDRMMELEEQKLQLITSIEKEKIEKPLFSYEQIIYWLTHIKEKRTIENLIDIFISKIFLYDNRLELYYHYTDENHYIDNRCFGVDVDNDFFDNDSNDDDDVFRRGYGFDLCVEQSTKGALV